MNPIQSTVWATVMSVTSLPYDNELSMKQRQLVPWIESCILKIVKEAVGLYKFTDECLGNLKMLKNIQLDLRRNFIFNI